MEHDEATTVGPDRGGPPAARAGSRPWVLVVGVVALVVAGLAVWLAVADRSTTVTNRAPVVGVRASSDGATLVVRVLEDPCVPVPGEVRAERDGGRLVLSVVQEYEHTDEQRFCQASCPVVTAERTLVLDPEWAGLRIDRAPDDGHCALESGFTRPLTLGTVPAR